MSKESTKKFRLKHPNYDKEYRKINKDKINKKQRENYWKYPKKRLLDIERTRQWRQNNKKYVSEWHKNNSLKLKKEVFSFYCKGIPKCKCCGIRDLIFLTIDHKKGGGNKHRKEISGSDKGGGGGHKMYHWIKKNNFPKSFQVLCFNCNFAKHYLKKCPHKQ